MKIHAITIDCTNPQALATWWSHALGIAVGTDYGMIVQLAASSAIPPMQFQKITDVPVHPNRVHADFRTSDLDGEIGRLVGLGATLVDKVELPQICYATLLDPDGNKFDLIAE